MATTYPVSKQTIPNPTSTDLLENATAALDHDYQHGTANDTIEALQDKVGINGSADTATHDYKLNEVTGTDKAVGKTATQTLTNKTLTSPQINMGGDQIGDMYYRNALGAYSRFAAGSDGQIIVYQGGVPTVASNPSAADASYATKGVVRIDTDAATSGLNVSSAVLSVNSGITANKILKLNSSAQIPAVDGSLLTNISTGKLYVIGSDSTVSNTNTETAIFSSTIPAGTLGANNAVRIILGVGTFNKASGDAMSLRFKLGGSTLINLQPNNAFTFSGLEGYIYFDIYANGATNVQKVGARTQLAIDNPSGATPTFWWANNTTSAAADSTTGLSVQITLEFASASVSNNITVAYASMEKIS